MLIYFLFFIYLIIAISTTAVISHPNSFCGIRISYTLDYPNIWHKTHQFASSVYWLYFLLLLVCSYILGNTMFLYILVFTGYFIPSILSVIYASILGSRYETELDNRDDAWRTQAEHEEEDIRIGR